MSEWKGFKDMPPLNDEEKRVLIGSGTEEAGTGKYVDFFEDGVYVCRQCGAPLYRSDDKFATTCGWPGFDDSVNEAVEMRPDPNPEKPWTEILCANCGGHLGHVFEGEGFTPKDIRHCVNSVSIAHAAMESALLAGGCFWGVEEAFRHLEGVILTEAGYSGGTAENVRYEDVKRGDAGHAEVVRVDFDPDVINYEDLLKVFFEIHDPTQIDRQGNDVGKQYRSVVFYRDEEQRQTAERVILKLRSKGIQAATQIEPAGVFWPAEEYHQKYFFKNPDKAANTCHVRRKINWD
jgi:peptide methionine sulfoxide reductase msrA/msrB